MYTNQETRSLREGGKISEADKERHAEKKKYIYISWILQYINQDFSAIGNCYQMW